MDDESDDEKDEDDDDEPEISEHELSFNKIKLFLNDYEEE